MTDSGAEELPSSAGEVLEGIRSRTERLEAALRNVLELETDGEQPRLRHLRRMRLLGESSLARGLSEERRAEFEQSFGNDGPFFDLNVLRIDGWTRDANSQWWPPEDPRVVLVYHRIALYRDPRATVMDDELLHTVIREFNEYLAKKVPNLEPSLLSSVSVTSSVAAAREGIRLLVDAEKLLRRELDPVQRERRHARRLELIGRDMAFRGVTERQLEPARLGSRLAELLFEDITLKTDGWTRSADGHWTAPVDEPGRAPLASG